MTRRNLRHRPKRLLLAAMSLVLLLLMTPAGALAGVGTSPQSPSSVLASPSDVCDYVAGTDRYLCYGFRAYWNDFGGEEVFGLPLTNEFQEDGRTVQYFERARFEWHPGVWPERHDVLQGRLGAELSRERAGSGPFAPADERNDCHYFEVTGHNLCDEFLDRWGSSGALPVFGYPISEVFEFEGVTAQYFERVRMERGEHDIEITALGVIPVNLAELRALTEPYHDVEAALADGYEPIEINVQLCVTHEHHGAMGIHYLKADLVGEDPIDIFQPQLLLYIPTDNGLELTGVEYFTPNVGQPHPVLFERYMDGPIDDLEGIPVHFQLHAWIWSDNPEGTFAQWNPGLTCP